MQLAKPVKITSMKSFSIVTSVATALALAVLPSSAATFTGPGTANGGGANGEGIGSVVINNTASDITFTINSSVAQSAYVQYYILMQYVGQGASGDTTLFNSSGALNGWGPSLGISTGMNAFAATWNTGASADTYSGGAWTQNASVNYDAGGTGNSFLTFTVPLSSLGLSVGSQFYFDVVSSYPSTAGQSAYGSLDISYPAETDSAYTPWNGTSAYDAATDAGTVNLQFGTAATMYTVVPEPAASALLGLGALVMIVRRRMSAAR